MRAWAHLSPGPSLASPGGSVASALHTVPSVPTLPSRGLSRPGGGEGGHGAHWPPYLVGAGRAGRAQLWSEVKVRTLGLISPDGVLSARARGGGPQR